MANRKLFVKGNVQSSAENDEEESEEEKYNALLVKWQDKLDSIFRRFNDQKRFDEHHFLVNQMNGESKLLQYMEERMQFLDEVRKHLIGFPFRPHLESQNVPSTVKSRDARELNKVIFCVYWFLIYGCFR